MPYDDLRKGRFSQGGQAYFITTVLADREQRFFADFECARIVVMNMKLLHDEKCVYSFAWVVMPDHVHWLFQLGTSASLSSTIKIFKARTAHRVNAYLGRSGTLWQKNFYDRALRKEEDMRAIARYIVANPLRGGLVQQIGDYPHWDAIWL
ncbi:MAG: transposase [Methylococcaceae bacterium]